MVDKLLKCQVVIVGEIFADLKLEVIGMGYHISKLLFNKIKYEQLYP